MYNNAEPVKVKHVHLMDENKGVNIKGDLDFCKKPTKCDKYSELGIAVREHLVYELRHQLKHLRTLIKKIKPNFESWATMSQEQKTAFEVADLKLIDIAIRFDVEGDPVEDWKVHLELGEKIYGLQECLYVEEEGFRKEDPNDYPREKILIGLISI